MYRAKTGQNKDPQKFQKVAWGMLSPFFSRANHKIKERGQDI